MRSFRGMLAGIGLLLLVSSAGLEAISISDTGIVIRVERFGMSGRDSVWLDTCRAIWRCADGGWWVTKKTTVQYSRDRYQIEELESVKTRGTDQALSAVQDSTPSKSPSPQRSAR